MLEVENLYGMSVGALLERAVQRFGENIAYIEGDKSLTFNELASRADEIGRALMALDIERGEHIALWMPNCIDWVCVFLAATSIGAAIVPLNPRSTVEEIAYILEQSESVAVVTVDDYLERKLGSDALSMLGRPNIVLEKVIVFGHNTTDGTISAEDLARFTESTSTENHNARKALIDAHEVALILYTSGTTGFPKGAMHSHAILRNFANAADRLQLSASDKLLLPLPLFHVFGLGALLSFLYCGGSILLMRSFDARQMGELVEKERATVLYGLDAIYYDLLREPSNSPERFASVRFCLCPVDKLLMREISERIGLSMNVYGMTETSGTTSLSNFDDSEERRTETAGTVLPGVEVKVRHENGQIDNGAVRHGELMVRGYPVMLGYYKNHKATRAVMDRDGWFRTGDLVEITEDGYLCFKGRMSDVFRVGGENVDPREVEGVLMKHPSILAAAVKGVPDARLGHVGAAYIVQKPGEKISEEELRGFVRKFLAGFKVPRYVLFQEELPRTGTGKVQKSRLPLPEVN